MNWDFITVTTDLFLFFSILEKVYNTYSTNQIFIGKQLRLWFSVWFLAEFFNKYCTFFNHGSLQNKLDQGEYGAGVFVDLKKGFDTGALYSDKETWTLWCQGSNKRIVFFISEKQEAICINWWICL